MYFNGDLFFENLIFIETVIVIQVISLRFGSAIS